MRYFEEVSEGDEIGPVQYGPVTIVDTVRWAGVQENWEQVHWDREFAREHSRLPTFIASGSYRQALLARMLTDWISPVGMLRRLRVRHTALTLEGDVIRYHGRVAEKSASADDPWIACELEGKNQRDELILTGGCVLRLATRTAGGRS
jgi:acyl dehydratase